MRSSVAAHVARWKYTGKERPPFAIAPTEGQESVWDYPRPPSCRLEPRSIKVKDDQGKIIASTTRAIKLYF
jgi:hypothetical protein